MTFVIINDMKEIDLYPKVCPLCGGEVTYQRLNKKDIFGHSSGYFYLCQSCGATVGTHKSDPTKALGYLADKETREMRRKIHLMFDNFWKNHAERESYYQKLADEMGISKEECHFSWFSKEELDKAYKILLKWWREKYDI